MQRWSFFGVAGGSIEKSYLLVRERWCKEHDDRGKQPEAKCGEKVSAEVTLVGSDEDVGSRVECLRGTMKKKQDIVWTCWFTCLV